MGEDYVKPNTPDEYIKVKYKGINKSRSIDSSMDGVVEEKPEDGKEQTNLKDVKHDDKNNKKISPRHENLPE